MSDRDTFLPTMALGDVLRDTWRKLLRNWKIMALCLTVSLVGSVYYVLTATPVYTASGALLIDPRVGQAPQSQGNVTASIASLDALTVDSELRVLVSREVTTRAMQAVGFGEGGEAEAEEGGFSPRSFLTGLLGGDDAADTSQSAGDAATDAGLPGELQAERRRESLRRSFVRGLRAQRAGDTYVIDIAYTSPDLVLAAEAVNALMQEYLRASGERQLAEVTRTRDWLSERIAELEVEVRAAETAVADFRGENELVALQGELLPTQVALNAAIEGLIRLQGEALVLEVQVQQLSEQIGAGEVEAIQLAPAEQSRALEEFQARYAELLREEQELLVSWAEDAPIVLSARQQQEQIRQLILDEYTQIRDRMATRSEALARQVVATEDVIEGLRDDYGGNARQTVELLNLEREADAKRQLYQQLLEEYNSSSQLLTFDSTNARVIAWAVPPDRKSAPQSRQIVVMAVFGGIVLALGLILLREALDGSFRDYHDVTEDTGLNLLGMVPAFGSEARTGGVIARLLGSVPPNAPGTRWHKLSRAGRRLAFANLWPASVSAETMRAIQVQLILQKNSTPEDEIRGQVVGLTSTTRGEGKTTTAFNLASFLARHDNRVAIVDLDLFSRQMSKHVAPILPDGNHLPHLLREPVAGVLGVEGIPEFPNLTVIGNVKSGEVSLPEDQDRIETLIAALKERFDVVVLDLPPVQGAAHTRLLSALCDQIIYTVRWGSTSRAQVKTVFSQRRLPKSNILGVLFTQANLRKYRWYNRHDAIYYYGST